MRQLPEHSYKNDLQTHPIPYGPAFGAAKKGFICDMDGVIYHGNKILPGVVEFIQWLQERLLAYIRFYKDFSKPW